MSSKPRKPHRAARPVDPPPADPALVWGAAAIGRVIGRSPRQTHYLLETGKLSPAARKVGAIWCGSPQKLIEHLSGDATADDSGEVA